MELYTHIECLLLDILEKHHLFIILSYNCVRDYNLFY